MINRPLVFVTQEVHTHDYMPAEAFGDVRILSSWEIGPFNTDRDQRVREQIAQGLADYRPGRDFILLSGSPIAQAITMMHVAVKWPSRDHQVLKWDNWQRQYISYSVDSMITYRG